MPEARQPGQRGRRHERGQALVIIAVALIGLLAFVGLTVDAGILFIAVGHLRRAVDAAAFAAAAQFREGRSFDQLAAAARQVVSLNGVEPTSLQLTTCVDRNDPTPHGYHDPALCPAPGAPQRKLVRIRATSRVQFTFLSLIGFSSTPITAQATSEAASVDVVLVLDTSDSMTQDAACGDGDDDDGDGVPDDGCDGSGYVQVGAHRDDAWSDTVLCNAGAFDDGGQQHFCHPFQEVKNAAIGFVNGLYFPYDRVAIVTFDIVPTAVVPLTNTLSVTDIISDIHSIPVSPRRTPGDPTDCTYPPDPSGCTNTSIGGGLKLAGNEFGRPPIRMDSVWVVILLTDGAANASEPGVGGTPINFYCPSTDWVQPFCRDSDVPTVTRHSLRDSVKNNPENRYDPVHYDADDYARDMADFVACPPRGARSDSYCRDSLNYDADPPEGGQGALIYSIGLGQLVLKFTGPDPQSGDRLLRYIAAVGDDGDARTDPCATVEPPELDAGNNSYNCGNYYFSEFGTGLSAVFESIAARIFTRLTQ